MKRIKLFTIALFVISQWPVEAQFSKGKLMIGMSSGTNISGELGTGSDLGSLNVGNLKQKSNASGFEEPDPEKYTNINFLPSVGYFLIDDLALGVEFTIAFERLKEEDPLGDWNQEKSTILMGGPYLRYYFPGSNVRPFMTGKFCFGTMKYTNEWTIDEMEEKTGLTGYGAGAGLAIPIGDKVTFDIMTGYNSLTTKDKNDNPDNDRTIIAGFVLKFGFIVYLGEK